MLIVVAIASFVFVVACVESLCIGGAGGVGSGMLIVVAIASFVFVVACVGSFCCLGFGEGAIELCWWLCSLVVIAVGWVIGFCNSAV